MNNLKQLLMIKKKYEKMKEYIIMMNSSDKSNKEKDKKS